MQSFHEFKREKKKKAKTKKEKNTASFRELGGLVSEFPEILREHALFASEKNYYIQSGVYAPVPCEFLKAVTL